MLLSKKIVFQLTISFHQRCPNKAYSSICSRLFVALCFSGFCQIRSMNSLQFYDRLRKVSKISTTFLPGCFSVSRYWSPQIKGHLTLARAGDVATRSGAKKLLFTHFYPECLKTDIEMQCRKTCKRKLILATDLMSLSVR